MNFKIFCLALPFALMGCSSEIDKCVDSQVKAWEISKKEAQARLDEKKEGSKLYELWDDMEITTMPKEKVEAEARLRCMKAAH